MDKTLSIAELKVHYTVKGDGAPVVILHGWGSSRRIWTEPQEILAENYRVYVPDLPGFGDTAPPAQSWSVGDYAFFVAELLAAWGVSEVYLIGHSFGGRVAIKMASEEIYKFANSQIGKLVLCASAGIKPPRTMKHRLFGAVAKIGKTMLGDNDAARKLLYLLAGERDYYCAHGVMRETMSRVVEEDLRPLLSKVTVPTLLVWGDADKLTPIGDARIMHQEIPAARLEIVPNAGHRLPYEQPREFCKIVKEFFG